MFDQVLSVRTVGVDGNAGYHLTLGQYRLADFPSGTPGDLSIYCIYTQHSGKPVAIRLSQIWAVIRIVTDIFEVGKPHANSPRCCTSTRAVELLLCSHTTGRAPSWFYKVRRTTRPCVTEPFSTLSRAAAGHSSTLAPNRPTDR